MDNTQQAKAVPLVEQLRSVPADARLSIDTPNALGCMDTRHFAVGRMCHEAAAALSLPVEAASESVREQAVAMTEAQIRDWWSSENGLEDCDLCKIDDFRQVVRAVEAKLYASPLPAVQTDIGSSVRHLAALVTDVEKEKAAAVSAAYEDAARIVEKRLVIHPKRSAIAKEIRAAALHQAHQKEGA